MLAEQSLRKNLLAGGKKHPEVGISQAVQGSGDKKSWGPLSQARCEYTEPRERKGQKGFLQRQGHQLLFVPRLQGGTDLRVDSLAPPTLLFPVPPCFCFNPQTNDHKGLKQEGLVIKKGMTQELKVSVWAQVARVQITRSPVKGVASQLTSECVGTWGHLQPEASLSPVSYF